MESNLLTLQENLKILGFTEFGIIPTTDYSQPDYNPELIDYYNESQMKNNFDMSAFNSIVVLLMNYRPEILKSGSMSIGSNEKDYHIVFREKIKELSELMSLGNFACYSDTGPLFDRTLAIEAGLGFIGKNGCLINPNIGSFFFIGYVLTDLKFEKFIPYDINKFKQPICFNCSRCIKACPTSAIREGEFRPMRCLSHLTQTKTPDPELEGKIKTFYGCDICQKVCPYNYEKPKGMSEFLSGDEMSYEDLFTLSNKEFKNKYGEKAFFWRGRSIVKRNAIIRAHNINDDSILKYLKEELKKDNITKEYILKYFSDFI